MAFDEEEAIREAASRLAAPEPQEADTGAKPFDPDKEAEAAASRILGEDRQRQAMRLQSYELGETASPDDAALHDRLAKKYGVPRRAVEYDAQSYKDKEAAERHALLERTSPNLLKWVDDADNYAVARDDFDNLSAIEKLMRGDVEAPMGQFIKAGNRLRGKAAGIVSDPGAAAAGAVSDAGSFGRSIATAAPAFTGGAISGFGEQLSALQQMNMDYGFGLLIGGRSTRLKEEEYWARRPELSAKITPYAGPANLMKTYGGVGKDIADEWRPDDQGFWGQVGEGLGQVAIAVGLAIPTGGKSLTSLSFAGLGIDQQAESMRAAGLDPNDYPGQLAAGGSITAISEKVRLNRIMKAIPASARKSVWQGILGRIAREGAEEGIQEIAEGLGQNALTMTYDEEARLIEGLAEAGGVGATVGAIFQAGIELAIPGKSRITVQHARPLSEELERMRTEAEPTEGETKLSNLIDLAVQSKTARRSPEKIEQYIAGMVDDATSTVAIDAEGLAQVIEDNGLDPDSVMEDLGLDPDALQKAAEEFGDVEVSTAKLAASKTLKNGTLIKEHARFSSEAMTPAQREQRREADIGAMKQVFNDFLQGKVDVAVADMSVTEQFMQRIEETGMYGNPREIQSGATIMSALVGSLAKVRGISIEQAFADHAPAIQGHFGLGGEMQTGALDQEGLPMDETARMSRAKADGFDTDTVLYHGTGADFSKFNKTTDGKFGPGVYLTSDSSEASQFAVRGGRRNQPEGGASVLPVLIRGKIATADDYSAALKAAKGNKLQAISDLKNKGFGGIKSPAYGIDSSGPSHVVIFDPKNIRSKFAKFDPEKRDSANLLDQPGLSGQFSPRDNIIHLFEAKNVSTLMHESAHWYLQTLIDLQARGQSTPEIDAMLAGVQEWYDAARAEGRYDEIVARYDIVETGGKFVLTYEGEERGQFFSREEAEQKRNWREMHEAFAETFEVYLRNGKAPNAKLRDAFRFFRDFLTNLYRKVKGNPSLSRANLNPEITAIFDRMLAVDDMVDGASSVMEIEANQMLQKMLDAGVLTEKEHARAVAKFPKMLAEMKEDLSARLWNSAQKRQDALMAGFKRDIRDAVAREYDASPVGRAEGMLGRNEWMGDVAEDVVVDDVNALTQEAPRSIGAMIRMTDEQIGEWYVENIREVRQDIGDDYRVVNLHFKTDDSLEREDAVVNFKIEGGKVNADLYLNSKTTADVKIKELTDAERKERQRKAANMFARAVAAIKHWVSLEQPGAVVFSGSSADHEKLYNFLLSTLAFEGYTAHRVNTIIGRITTEDNVTEGEAILPPMQQFVVLKDGENLGDYSETESVKGRSGTTDTGTWQGYHAVYTEEIGPVRSADGRYERRGLRTGAVGTQRSSSGTQGQIEGATNGNAQRNNGLDGSVPDGKLQGPVVLPDGTTELVHYGREQGLSRSDPSRWGAGGAFLPRSERNRISDAPARTYFGLNVGLPGGYTKEEGTGDNTYYSYIPFDRLYDFGADADNLVERGREIARERRIDVLSAVEHAVKDAGYAGFYRDHPSLGMVGAVFEEIELASERRQEAVWAYESITEPGLYQRAGDGRGRDPGRRLTRLEGAPSVPGFSGPDPRLVGVAERYARQAGVNLRRQAEYASIDPDRAARIAQAYADMEHAPNDPAVREAYDDLIRQTIAQYRALEQEGYRFWFIDLNRANNQEYASIPWNAMRDIRANKTMGVFPTNDGFGSQDDFSAEANPLLADTGIQWPVGSPDGPLQPVLANDLFRAVHDAFGHGLEGAGFRARGEENAWQAHVRLFTGPAIGAITSETRGQNSWLNFGPHGETNRTAKTEDTIFADQKTGLMPEWTWQEGRARDAGPDPDGLGQVTPDPNALNQVSDNPESFGLTPEQVERVNSIYRPEALPTERMASNQQAALWLEGLFTGEGITDFTIELTDEQIDEISSVMTAEAMLALQKTGNASDWYSDAMMRAIDMASVKYPMLKDDTAAELAGFGSASNARFAFTYIMAVTSQNLDVAANSIATDKAFSEMITRVADGDYSMPARWGTGDKQKAMGLNFEKFEKLIDAMPGGENGFPAKLAALDTMFRSSMTVSEWERFAKEEGIPFKAPGQTAKDAVVYGSSVLGPKIGNGFWQNLNGNFSPLTIDLWMRRTWGRLTGKSIGNPDALPAQRKRLADAVKRSRSREQGKPDHIAAIEAGIAATKKQLAGLKRSDFANKKEFSAEERRLKAELAASIETLADMANLKAPEAWKTQYNKSSNDLLAFAKRLLKVWDVEYNRLRKANGSVPAEMQPTWARAAKTIITNLAKPLDQVANGTQRKQIERAVKQALDKLDARGIELSTADLQAILWYPEKELWGALTDELNVDEDGVPIVEASSLNESYDTVWTRILEGQGYEIPRTEGDGSGRGRGAGAVAGQDAGSGRPQDAGGIGQAGAAPFGREGGRQGYGLTELDQNRPNRADDPDGLAQKRRNPNGWGAVTPPSNVHPVRLDLKSVRDAYGDEAVDRLPRSVVERATSSNTVEDMMALIETIKADLKAKPPKSLFAFVRSRGRKGKIKGPNGISGAADDLRALGLENLINEKSGRDIDYVRELAEEAGYLQPSPDGQTTSINDLLEALQREANGDPVYAEQDLADASANENAEGWRVFLDENDVDIYEKDKRALEAAVRRFVEGAQEDAVTADEAADMFGFDTGEDLIAALIQEGDRERVIRDETERRFKEEYGDLYESGQLANEIEMEVNTELRARKAEMEFEALTRAAGRLPARRLARQMAQESLSIMPIGEINKRFKSWRRDAETHGRNALAEAQKGNWDKVAQSKKYELVALAMHEEGAKLLERAEKVRADLTKYETSKYRREKIANDYLERIDALLEGYELRKSKQGPSEQRRRQSAADYVAWMTAEGREDEIAAEASLLAEMANDKVWRNLTIDEADYLHATVKNLAHLGRTKDRLLNEQDKRRFNAVIDELVGRMKDTGKLPPIMGLKFTSVTRDRSPTRTVTETAVDALREGNSWLMRPEHQARSLDGEELGPVWQAIFRPMAEASDVETRMMRESTALYREAWSKFSAKDRKRMMNVNVSVPELRGIGKRFTRMDLISIALNWGVEYNRDVLMEGYGWNKQQVESALFRTLGDKEWDFVEAIWEIAGMHKEEAFALEKDMTGVEPKAVEGVDFTLPSGRVIKGKYYHIEYDGNQPGEASRRQLKDNAAAELSTHRKSRTKAQTKNGGLIARKGSGGRPVKLSLSVFERGLSETIHDIAFRRAVLDVGRIVSDKSFADTYQEVAGLENYRQLDVWLKDIANPPSEALDPIVRAFAHVRRNIPIAVMGMKVGTALIQPSGILAAMPIVGHRRMALAVAQAFANPNKSLFGAWSAVAEKSEFMRDRIAGYERDVRETTTALTKGGATDFLRRNAFVFINGMDVAVSTPVWMAAYGKAFDGKVKGIQAGQEEDAILWADGIIRRTQTAGKMQDLSRFQRGGEFQKQISMIFSYFNNLYALSAQNTMDMRRGKMTRIAWAYQMSILFVAIPLMAEAMAGRLFPGDDDDDDDTLAGNMGQAVISNFAGMFPGIRDVVSLNLKPEFGYRLSPTAKFIEDIGKTAGLPFQLALDSEKELTEYDVKRAVNALGGMTGIPSAQINITGDYIVDLIEGNEDPAEDPVDAMSEAFVRNTR